MIWSWIFVGLPFISKLDGYSEGNFPQVCESMRPHHGRGGAESLPQTSKPPFMVSYELGSNVGDPITVSLESTNGSYFMGFMLEARNLSLNGDGSPLGKFILLDTQQSRLLTCGNSQDSAVSNALNLAKRLVKVNWTSDGEEQDIIFRATFLESYSKYWERVDVAVLRPTRTPEPETITAIATTAATTTGAATTSAATTTRAAVTTEPATTGSAVTTAAAATTAAATTTGSATTAAATTTGSAVTTAAAATTGAATTAAAATTGATTTSQIPTTKTVLTEVKSNTTNETVNILLICVASPLAEMSMQIPIIIMAVHLTLFCHDLHLTTSFYHDLCKKFRIVRSSLSVLFSLATLILSLIYNSEDIIIGLVSVVLAISSIEWIIAMLPLGPSHELNELFDYAAWVCFVVHQVFINVFLYVSINSLFEEWGETTRVFWLLTVHTVLTIVCNMVLCIKKRTLLQKKRVSVIDKTKYNQHHKGKKENFSLKGPVFVLCSVTLVVLSTSLSVLIFVDYF